MSTKLIFTASWFQLNTHVYTQAGYLSPTNFDTLSEVPGTRRVWNDHTHCFAPNIAEHNLWKVSCSELFQQYPACKRTCFNFLSGMLNRIHLSCAFHTLSECQSTSPDPNLINCARPSLSQALQMRQTRWTPSLSHPFSIVSLNPSAVHCVLESSRCAEV